MKISHYLLASLLCVALVSCSEEEPQRTGWPDSPMKGFFVVNQGNAYSQIPGSLSFGDFTDFIVDLPLNVTGGVLGDGPQKATCIGDNFYVPCNSSNCISIVNTRLLSGSRIEMSAPQCACTDGKYVYVTESNGSLARLNATTFKIDRVTAGDSPYGCTYANGKVYVNCGPWEGWNPVGTKVMVMSVEPFEKIGEIEVGLNPYDQITTDIDGNVYTVCCGNYADVPSEVWRISPDGTAEKLCDGEVIAVSSTLPEMYVVNRGEYTLMNTRTRQSTTLPIAATDKPSVPISAAVCPADGSLYVTADGEGAEGYNIPGGLFVYNKQGALLRKYVTGVHPYCVLFN